MKSIEDEPAELFGEDGGVEIGKRQELSARSKKAIGHKRVKVRVEGGERAEGLETRHEARNRVLASENFLEAGPDCLVGTSREESKESPIALEESSQRLWKSEYEVAVRDGCEDLLQELLGEEC